MNWSYTTLKCALCLCVFAFLYFKHIWFQFKKSLRILCGLALSQEIVQETSFHHPFLTVSLVLSWWPPAFSFAVIVVWGARIMKRKNGWPFDCPQDSPPPLLRSISWTPQEQAQRHPFLCQWEYLMELNVPFEFL